MVSHTLVKFKDIPRNGLFRFEHLRADQCTCIFKKVSQRITAKIRKKMAIQAHRSSADEGVFKLEHRCGRCTFRWPMDRYWKIGLDETVEPAAFATALSRIEK